MYILYHKTDYSRVLNIISSYTRFFILSVVEQWKPVNPISVFKVSNVWNVHCANCVQLK